MKTLLINLLMFPVLFLSVPSHSEPILRSRVLFPFCENGESGTIEILPVCFPRGEKIDIVSMRGRDGHERLEGSLTIKRQSSCGGSFRFPFKSFLGECVIVSFRIKGEVLCECLVMPHRIPEVPGSWLQVYDENVELEYFIEVKWF